MPLPKIIGIVGPKGSGKSTLANLLVQSYGYHRNPFAYPLKTMISSLLDIQGCPPQEIERMLDGDLKEVPTDYLAGRTPRLAMQTLGTEWRDLIDRNLWARIWRRRTLRLGRVVADDVRFLHEANVIRDMGGLIVTVARTRQFDLFDDHASEKGWLSIVPDAVVNNHENSPAQMLTQFDKYMSLLGRITLAEADA
jgi:energy-coupling factor transporter ATP-binding protein EcfA2